MKLTWILLILALVILITCTEGGKKDRNRKSREERKRERENEKKNRKAKRENEKKNKLKSFENMLQKGGRREACENKPLKIECDRKKEIQIEDVTFGRVPNDERNICGKKQKYSGKNKCGNDADAKSEVEKRCNGKRKCNVKLRGKAFDKKCGKTLSILSVEYKCNEPRMKKANARQEKTLRNPEDLVKEIECMEREETLAAEDPENNEVCQCIAWGDPHYEQFDGMRVNFQGVCEYVVSKMFSEGHECFYEITAQNEKRRPDAAVTYVKWVKIESRTSAETTTTIQLLKNGKFKVNGNDYTDEFSGLNWVVSPTCGGGTKFVRNDPAKPQCFLEVFFDGNHKAIIKIRKAIGKVVKGLCGNCDGIKNDKRTADDKEIKDCTQNRFRESDCDRKIGNSFLVPSSDKNANEQCKTNVKDVPECPADIMEIVDSNEFCGLFKAENSECFVNPFRECLDILDWDKVEPIYKGCKEDVCNGKDGIFACNALTSLHFACSLIGIYPDWRTPEFCDYGCPMGSSYAPDAPLNEETCDGSSNVCNTARREGCMCDSGFVRRGKQCIPKSECNSICKKNGVILAPGEERMFENCKKVWKCVMNPKGSGRIVVSEPTDQCTGDKNAECNVDENSIASCDCKDGYKRKKKTGSCEKSEEPDTEEEKEKKRINKKKKEEKKKARKKRNKKAKKKKPKRSCSKKGKHSKNNKGKKVVKGSESCKESDQECECIARGDPHYTLFDPSQRVDFQGDCSYTLSKTKDPAHPCAYHIKAKNWKLTQDAKVARTKQITVVFGENTVVFGQKNKRIFNGNEEAKDTQGEGFTITRTSSSNVLVIEKPGVCRVEITFNGVHEAKVKINKGMGNDVEGICGNCNDIPDDLITKDGEDVATWDKRQRDKAIGGSWEVYEPTSEGEHCSSESIEPLCQGEWVERSRGPEYCGQLTDPEGAFKDALDAIAQEDIDNLVAQCIEDVCGNSEEPTLPESFCQKKQSMASLANAQGVLVDWRGEDCSYEPACLSEKNQVYKFDASGCPARCGAPEPEVCDFPPGEGCACMDGYVLSGDNCVKESECGCTYGETVIQYFDIGDTFLYGDCTKTYTCTVNEKGVSNVVSSEDTSCDGEHEKCVINANKWVSCGCMDGYKMEDGLCVPLVECDLTTEKYLPSAPRIDLQNTCVNPNSVIASTPRQPGCVCQTGLIREYTNGICKPISPTCKCTDGEGNLRDLGEDWTSPDCSKNYLCTPVDNGAGKMVPGILTSEGITCVNGQCVDGEDGKKICNCDPSFVREGNECVKMCDEPTYMWVDDGNGGYCKKVIYVCKAIRERFIDTFDGYRFGKLKNCEYVMVENVNADENCQVKVSIKIREGIDWIEWVKIHFKKISANKESTIKFFAGRVTEADVDGTLKTGLGNVNLDTVSPLRGKLYKNMGKLNVEWWNNCNVHVIYDGGKYVSVYLKAVSNERNPLVNNNVQGLCANADDDGTNELITVDGLDVNNYPGSVKYDMFVHGYRQESGCGACTADAITLQDRDDVCGAYDNAINNPEVAACLSVVDPAYVKMLKESCKAAICHRYSGDHIDMFRVVCNFWIDFRKACEAQGLNMVYRPYGCNYCTCKVMGDPHTHLYDHQLIDFMGKCEYVYTEFTDKNSPCYFRVELKHDDRGTNRVSWVESAKIHFSNTEPRQVLELLPGRLVKFNGVFVEPPVEDLYDGMVLKNYATSFIMVRWNKCGFRFKLDSETARAYMDINPIIGNKVRGICGNCDGVQNDFVDAQGNDLNQNENTDRVSTFNQIGESFIADSIPADQYEDCKTNFDPNSCPSEIKSAVDNKEYCGYFLVDTPGPFQTCVRNIPSKELKLMYESCLVDVCQTIGDYKTICGNIKDLAERCEEDSGTPIDWQTDSLCPQSCDDNEEYSGTAPGCPMYCTGAQTDCDLPPYPGCQCKAGYIRDSNNVCVHQSNCGCIQDNKYHPVYQVWLSSDCTKEYKCASVGVIITEEKTCGNCVLNAELGKYECVASNAPKYDTSPSDETTWARARDIDVDSGDLQRYKFTDEIGSIKWGWFACTSTPGTYDLDVYAGAGDNDITKGSIVGTFTFTLGCAGDVCTVDFSYSMVTSCAQGGSNNMLAEAQTNLSNGKDSVYTDSPGQFKTKEAFSPNADSYAVSGLTKFCNGSSQCTLIEIKPGDTVCVSAHGSVEGVCLP